eukprot:Cvel_9086.t1-p1 / transcript=Cvel_9086.t1 / gene=Cvel_9086 / organism=Chromera_velia_CCMP2878 / gene_product=hypothetical protein / transcript_product=hypothetical protein / location=Cvel_scaffold515:77513-82754(+) / protein_length=859 / sequence_SO=supercontig / SO=protein_coding / is_pseudo=false
MRVVDSGFHDVTLRKQGVEEMLWEGIEARGTYRERRELASRVVSSALQLMDQEAASIERARMSLRNLAAPPEEAEEQFRERVSCHLVWMANVCHGFAVLLENEPKRNGKVHRFINDAQIFALRLYAFQRRKLQEEPTDKDPNWRKPGGTPKVTMDGGDLDAFSLLRVFSVALRTDFLSVPAARLFQSLLNSVDMRRSWEFAKLESAMWKSQQVTTRNEMSYNRFVRGCIGRMREGASVEETLAEMSVASAVGVSAEILWDSFVESLEMRERERGEEGGETWTDEKKGQEDEEADEGRRQQEKEGVSTRDLCHCAGLCGTGPAVSVSGSPETQYGPLRRILRLLAGRAGEFGYREEDLVESLGGGKRQNKEEEADEGETLPPLPVPLRVAVRLLIALAASGKSLEDLCGGSEGVDAGCASTVKPEGEGTTELTEREEENEGLEEERQVSHLDSQPISSPYRNVLFIVSRIIHDCALHCLLRSGVSLTHAAPIGEGSAETLGEPEVKTHSVLPRIDLGGQGEEGEAVENEWEMKGCIREEEGEGGLKRAGCFTDPDLLDDLSVASILIALFKLGFVDSTMTEFATRFARRVNLSAALNNRERESNGQAGDPSTDFEEEPHTGSDLPTEEDDSEADSSTTDDHSPPPLSPEALKSLLTRPSALHGVSTFDDLYGDLEPTPYRAIQGGQQLLSKLHQQKETDTQEEGVLDVPGAVLPSEIRAPLELLPQFPRLLRTFRREAKQRGGDEIGRLAHQVTEGAVAACERQERQGSEDSGDAQQGSGLLSFADGVVILRSSVHGHGVFTTRKISQGERVCTGSILRFSNGYISRMDLLTDYAFDANIPNTWRAASGWDGSDCAMGVI